MNQILYEDIGENKPTDIKKIVIFFGIVIIFFGIILGAIGVVQMLNSSKSGSITKPVIMIEKYDDYSLRINVTHDKEIEKIIYSWNDGEEQTIDGGKRKNIERLIDMPLGENTLTMQVIDVLGISQYKTGTYSGGGRDSSGPRIKLSQVEENGIKKIHIYAEDDSEISFITYRWNDSEEITIDEKDSSNTIIETNVEIPTDLPSGSNKLYISAVDGQFNTTQEQKEIKIAKKPIIEQPHQYGGELAIRITDEKCLDYVRYSLNGESYTWKNSDDTTKVCEARIKLQPGRNDIVITAGNKEGIEAKPFYGWCIYSTEN